MTGLSLSTVSLALRGGETLKPDTRQKVAEAAAALGYVPDRAGVRLRTGKTNVIALVLDGAEESIDFARHMIQGIGRSMAGTRYHLTVMPEFERHSADTVRYILQNRTADGVILTHTSRRDPRVALMAENGFPFVTHGRTELAPHPFLDFDSEAFTTMATERLAGKGCKRLLLVIGDDSTTNHHNIVSAFRNVTERLGLTGEISAGASTLEMRALGLKMAKAKTRPDGILCDSETRSLALIGGLQEGGLVLGGDIALLYKQTSDILPTLFPRLDSIREDVFAAGGELTQLLLQRIDGVAPEELQTLAAPLPQWRS